MTCNNLDAGINSCTLKMRNMLNAAVMSIILKNLDMAQDGSFNRSCPVAERGGHGFVKCPWKDKDSLEKGL
jgi:hypothetical protein